MSDQTNARTEKAEREVSMMTSICSDEVIYEVVIGSGYGSDLGDAETVWERRVLFGSRDKYRAGGHAFVTAARMQEKVAARLIAGDSIEHATEGLDD